MVAGTRRRSARASQEEPGSSSPAPKLRHSYTVPPPEGSLGEFIRRERVARNWTQEYLADLVDVRQPQISAVERGEIKMPDPATIVRLAEAFGVDKARLLELTPWQGATRRLESVPPPGALVVPGAKGRPLLAEVVDACVGLSDDELRSVLNRIDHLLETRDDAQEERQGAAVGAADDYGAAVARQANSA